MKVRMKKVKIRVKNKDTVNIEAILRIYDEALQKIKGPRNEPLNIGALSELHLHDDESQGVGTCMKLWYALSPETPIKVADALELDLKLNVALSSDLFHEYTRQFKDYLANTQGWDLTQRGRLDRIDQVVEQPTVSEKIVESRYTVLFECCSRLVAFALSEAGAVKTNPVTVCEALEYFISEVLRNKLLDNNGYMPF